MRTTRWLTAHAALLTALVGSPAAAQESDTTDVEQLRRQIEAITRELEQLRLGTDVVAEADTGILGFGPAASKIYRTNRGVSLGGYGEFLYQRFANEREDGTSSGLADQLDALRAILYVGYKFDDRFLFNSEIEIEHGSTEEAGSVSLEFAFLEYRIARALGVRAGLLLPPMGFINELHEPPIFLGARRPETERRIIPSTWRENGIGLFGEAGAFSYRAYAISGFDASGFSSAGLRGGRQNGSEALAADFGGVVRIDYEGVLGLTIGGSAYLGNSGQGAGFAARTLIAEGHAGYQAHGLRLRGLVAVATVDDAAQLNASLGLTGTASVGRRMVGWYTEGGYDLLRHAATRHELIPFLRVERLNTQDDVPAGFAADPATDRTLVTVGLAWKPIPRIALKSDYQFDRNRADTGVDHFNVALGYLF